MDAPPGQRLLPVLIDEQAQRTPAKVFASIPKSSMLGPGCYRDVTMEDFVRAIDRLCELLEPLIGYSTNLNTVAYLGLPDMRYQIVIVALMKLGHKMLCSAPRNSYEMHAHLFKEADCSTILYAEGVDLSGMLGPVREGRTAHVIPSLEHLLWSEVQPKHYPYTKTFEQVKNDPYIVVHTSGSTGMPKPVFQSHAYAAVLDAQIHYRLVDGRRTVASIIGDKRRTLKGLPPWHPSGAHGFTLLICVFGENCTVWYPPDRLPSPKDAMDIMTFGNCEQVLLGIDLYQALAKMEGGLEKLASMKAIWWGGGSMDEELGNAIVQAGGNLMSVFGSTESSMPGLPVESDAWNCVHWHPSLKGMEFRDAGAGLYEQFIVRDSESEDMHAVWTVFPDLKEWPMKDIYSPHAKYPNHWIHRGRTDDLITFRNAGKYNPLAFEGHLRTHPLIQDALLVGTGRNQSALLLQLNEGAGFDGNDASRERAIEQIWPTVEEANEKAPKHGRVVRSHLIVAPPDKPFSKTSKGTVQRVPTLRAFKKEIDELYEQAGDNKVYEVMPAVVNRN